MEDIDWGAAHVASASMESVRAFCETTSAGAGDEHQYSWFGRAGLAGPTTSPHTSLKPGQGGVATKKPKLGREGGAAQSYWGGIKKPEKSPREATNGGQINAEGKKKHEKQIEAGGGTATKKPSKCPGTWYGQGLAPINNLLLT